MSTCQTESFHAETRSMLSAGADLPSPAILCRLLSISIFIISSQSTACHLKTEGVSLNLFRVAFAWQSTLQILSSRRICLTSQGCNEEYPRSIISSTTPMLTRVPSTQALDPVSRVQLPHTWVDPEYMVGWNRLSAGNLLSTPRNHHKVPQHFSCGDSRDSGTIR